MRFSTSASIVLTVFYLTLLPGLGGAADTYWQAGTGSWITETNWSNGRPGSDDVAYINNAGTANVTSSAGSCRELYLGEAGGESGTVDINAGSLTVNDQLGIGDAGTGVLYIRGGASFSNPSDIGTIPIGAESTGDGTVIVSGAGSIWNRAGSVEMWVGRYGQGSVTIQDGGEIDGGSAAIGPGVTGDGSVTVTGSGSSWTNVALWIAERGVAELIIENGGTVSTAYTEIGALSGSDGSATVSGSGSTFSHSSYLAVGVGGTGSLTVEDGADVSVVDTSGVGVLSGSVGTMTVTDSGSSSTFDQDLILGYEGDGSLTIQQGGVVSDANGVVGSEPGSDGSVLVDGNRSTWLNSGSLYVGGNDTSAGGTGELTVTNGGSVSLDDTLRIWAPGTINVNAGQLHAGIVRFDGSTLNMGDAAAEVTVDDLLHFGLDAAFTAVSGSSIYMQSADLENLQTDEAELAGLASLELIFAGNPVAANDLEVACEDKGTAAGGYDANFALGKLTVGGESLGNLRLVDETDNGNRNGAGGAAEALYVDSLELGAGSVLDLNGLHLYWRTQFIDHGGTILNGTVSRVSGQAILNPTDDAFISMEEPDRNWSSDGYVSVRNRYGGMGSDSWERNSLVKFDLSSIAPSARIISATLHLYYFDCIFSNCDGRDLTCRGVTSGWNEGTVTWNTRPGVSPAVTDEAAVPSTSGWMAWDVTSDVQAIVNGQLDNEGWQISDEDAWGYVNVPDARFRSKEYRDSVPYLEIVYRARPDLPSLTGGGLMTLVLLLVLVACSGFVLRRQPT